MRLNRRRFIQQTASAAAALYMHPIRLLAATERPGARKEIESPLDGAVIRKLASQVAGHLITPQTSDYESARLVGNRAYDRHPAVIVRCASPPTSLVLSILAKPIVCRWRCGAEVIAPPDSGCAMVAS